MERSGIYVFRWLVLYLCGGFGTSMWGSGSGLEIINKHLNSNTETMNYDMKWHSAETILFPH
jgi:hypothetical protein